MKGPSRRSWNKEPNEMKTILEKLGVCPFENKIVSPAQAEKKLTKEKKTLLNYHVSYSEPNLISVNCTDRRKKVVIVENVFKKYVNRNQMKIEDNSKGV